MSGTLFVVATPIGNLSDLSERARRTLVSCDLILAEDTRETRKLCVRYGIATPVESYHKFSEKGKLDRYLALLREGRSLALVSDAGTPAVSDPGKLLVAAALDEGIRVSPVPGPSAAAAAFSVSGMVSDRFLFVGFLAAKGATRERELDEALAVGVPIVLYEAPTRVSDLLARLAPRCERIVVCRELTKEFEEVFVYRGEKVREQGEFTIVAEPRRREAPTVPPPDADRDQILAALSVKDALVLLTRLYPTIAANDLKRWLYAMRGSTGRESSDGG